MSVKIAVTVEITDWNRAKELMDRFITAVDGTMKGGDKAKFGFERKIKIGRHTSKKSDDHEWLFGEERPTLEDIGFTTSELPIDALLRERSAQQQQTETALLPFRRAFDDADGDEEEEE